MKKLIALVFALACVAFAQTSNSELTATAIFAPPVIPDLIRTLNVDIKDTNTAANITGFFVVVIYENHVGVAALLTQFVQASVQDEEVTAKTTFTLPTGSVNAKAVVEPMSPSGGAIAISANY